MADADRRATIAAAFKDAEAEVETTPEPEAVVEAPPEEPAEPEVEAEPADTAEPAPDRDKKGRFKPLPKGDAGAERAAAKKVEPAKAPDATAAPAAQAAPAPTAPAAPKTPEIRPPQSLKALAREAWTKAPAEMRPLLEDVVRLEGEARKVLQENATLRRDVAEQGKFKEGVDSFVRPFEGIFRAQGVEPLQGVANVVQTYAALHYGAPAQKAGILAQLIGQFSNVDDVNAVLQGQVPAGPPMRTAQPKPPEDVRAVIKEELSRFQTTALDAKAHREFEEFQAGTPEFLTDVWDDMQDYIDLSGKRGRNVTYQQAYDWAVKHNEGVQALLAQRKAAEAATATPSANPAQRARVAAATVRSKPATAVTPAADPNDRHALIERLMNEAS